MTSRLIQFAPSFAPRSTISHVLFDFDGTLSLARQGWPDVMAPMFAEMLPPLPGESHEQRCQIAFEDIMRLNGKQTIYQMIQLADRIRERGGVGGDSQTRRDGHGERGGVEVKNSHHKVKRVHCIGAVMLLRSRQQLNRRTIK